MDLSPKREGETILDVRSRLPSSLEEAVAHIESKFPTILESSQAYEEFSVGDSITRATHVTYAFHERVTSDQTIRNVIQAWLLCMMESVINSSRSRMYWRLKPQLALVPEVFPDGPGFAVQIRSRSSMV